MRYESVQVVSLYKPMKETYGLESYPDALLLSELKSQMSLYYVVITHL